MGEGTGLCLSVVHGIIHEHQGHILIDTEVGQGTTFNLLFPKIESVRAANQPVLSVEKSDVESLESTSSIEGKHLLVVDDESSLLMMLQDWLENKSFNVHAFL